MTPRALVTGITGQDGSYLADLLLEKGYEIHGLVRSLDEPVVKALEEAGVKLHEGDVREPAAVAAAIRESAPAEIYHLAGATSVGVSWAEPALTSDVIVTGTARLLEAMRALAPTARLFNASSCEVFGNGAEQPQTEATPQRPTNPYGIAKAAGHALVAAYRDGEGLHATNGILFNHESVRRSASYVTRKITQAAAAISLGQEHELRLGALDARRDWGHAPEYVEAMWLSLQQEEASDYVIATGRLTSVREWLELAFAHVGLDPADHVVTDPALVRPTETSATVGNATRARERLGWQARTSVEALVAQMVDADLALLRAEAS